MTDSKDVTNQKPSGRLQLSLFSEPEESLRPLTFRETALLAVDELYGRADDGLLRILKEDKRVERKPASILKSHELADYYSMWANTGSEGGLIAVGIANNGEFLGCSTIEIEHINRLEKEAHDQCPEARVESKRVRVRRNRDLIDDFIVLFRVHFHPKKVVFTVRGEAFNRLGESKHKLSHDEITELQNEKGEIHVEQESCVRYTFPDDFDMEYVNEFADSVRANLSEPITPQQILATRRLGTFKNGKFIPNAACVLVFAKDPRLDFPGARIQLMRFEGEQEGVGRDWNAVKDEFAEGPLPAMLEIAATFLDSQLRRFSSLGEDGHFYSAPEYPRDVWYEALVNALVHRSYGALRNMSVKVKMFDDRLEIESPGGFPTGVTPENIYDAISHPRNQFLMEATWFLNVVKMAGEGTRRMRKLMRESRLPDPDFRQRELGHTVVRVVLRNNIKQRKALIDSGIAASVISPDVYRTLTEPERLILNHVAANGTINTTQAVRITGKGWKSVHRILLKLAGRGVLIHHHSKKDKDPFAHFTLPEGPRTSTEKG
jgi:ATP-dependent DNA helicase RecG